MDKSERIAKLLGDLGERCEEIRRHHAAMFDSEEAIRDITSLIEWLLGEKESPFRPAADRPGLVDQVHHLQSKNNDLLLKIRDLEVENSILREARSAQEKTLEEQAGDLAFERDENAKLVRLVAAHEKTQDDLTGDLISERKQRSDLAWKVAAYRCIFEEFEEKMENWREL